MIWGILSTLGMGFVGGIINMFAGDEQAKQERKDLKTQYGQDMAVYDKQLAVDKAQAMEDANALLRSASQKEASAREGFGLTVADARVEQRLAAAQLSDQAAANARGLSTMDAAAGLSGVKDSGTTALVRGQAETQAKAQEKLASDTQRDQAMLAGKRATLGLSDKLFGATEDRTKAAETMATFDPGSAYMDLFNTKKALATENYRTALGNTAYQDIFAAAGKGDWGTVWTSLLRSSLDFNSGYNGGFNTGSNVYNSLKQAGLGGQA